MTIAGTLTDLRVPDGWTLELLDRRPDYLLLSTPLPRRYMATLDFGRRGFRSRAQHDGHARRRGVEQAPQAVRRPRLEAGARR